MIIDAAYSVTLEVGVGREEDGPAAVPQRWLPMFQEVKHNCHLGKGKCFSNGKGKAFIFFEPLVALWG